MRTDFKIVNGRDVRTIGYDPEHKICVIEYNHINGGKSRYYHNVEKNEFDIVFSSNDISTCAEEIFKDKIKH